MLWKTQKCKPCSWALQLFSVFFTWKSLQGNNITIYIIMQYIFICKVLQGLVSWQSMLINVVQGNVFVYYGLKNFHQNLRRYMDSRDDGQMVGRKANLQVYIYYIWSSYVTSHGYYLHEFSQFSYFWMFSRCHHVLFLQQSYSLFVSFYAP